MYFLDLTFFIYYLILKYLQIINVKFYIEFSEETKILREKIKLSFYREHSN